MSDLKLYDMALGPPCAHCREPERAHVDGKCLFEPTVYQPGELLATISCGTDTKTLSQELGATIDREAVARSWPATTAGGMACKHCGELEVDHGPASKCLFEATSYSEGDTMIVDVALTQNLPFDPTPIIHNIAQILGVKPEDAS